MSITYPDPTALLDEGAVLDRGSRSERRELLERLTLDDVDTAFVEQVRDHPEGGRIAELDAEEAVTGALSGAGATAAETVAAYGVGDLETPSAEYDMEKDGAELSSGDTLKLGYVGEAMKDHVLHPLSVHAIGTHETVHAANDALNERALEDVSIRDSWVHGAAGLDEAVDEAIAQYVTLGQVDDLHDEGTRKWFYRNRAETYLERAQEEDYRGPDPFAYQTAAAHISDRMGEAEPADADEAIEWLLGNRERLVEEIDGMDPRDYGSGSGYAVR